MAGEKTSEETVTLPKETTGKLNEQKEQAPKKQKSQIFFGIGIVLLLSITIPFVYESIKLNNFAHQNKPEGHFFPGVYDLPMVLVSALACHLYQRLCHFVFRPIMVNYVKEQDHEELREKLTQKACNAIYVTTYFIFATVYGWLVLKDTLYLPWYLGGLADGSWTNIPIHTIYVPVDMSLYYYSFVTWGYHLNSLASHLFLEVRTNDFEEMMLHHMATNGLYFAFIFGNQIPIGCLISYIHDIADVPGFIVKLTNTTKYTYTCAAFFIVTIVLWFHTRLFAFPQIIYYIFTEHIYPPEFAQFQWYVTLNGMFLTPLVVLHAYWFCLFIIILHGFITKGEDEDLQNNVRKAVSPTGAEKSQKSD